MQDVKNIDKAMTIGSGSNSYKGVSDKDVKQKIGQSMANNGLTCLCIDMKPTMRIDRWEEVDQWSKSTPKAMKTKQSIFTEVLATYKITHAETDESIDIMGYGHGVDPQDKSAGKATTYALKNALLYTFLVPTGAIDDTDATHSNDTPTPPTKKPKATPKEVGKSEDPSIESMTKWVKDRQKTMGGVLIDANFCNDNYTLKDAQYKQLLKLEQ